MSGSLEMSLKVVLAGEPDIADLTLERPKLLMHTLDVACHVLPLAKGLVADGAREGLVS